MTTHYIVDVEKDADMKSLSPKEAIHKLESMRNTCQKLIDEKVKFERLVGTDAAETWNAETPFDDTCQNLIEALTLAIAALKQQEQDRWIPVTEHEQLPEDEYVLISKKPTKLSGSKWCVTLAKRTADPRSGITHWRDIGFGVIRDDKVLAWKPLPEKYQEGEQDGD